MSKDLEKEYRALMDSEAPDLWARIEAGLEEKPVRLQQKRSIGKRRHMKIWASLAAACACVALSIPVMTRSLTSGGSGSDTAAPDNNTAFMECAPEAAERAVNTYAGEIMLEEGVCPAAVKGDDNAGTNSDEDVAGSVCDGTNPSASDKADSHLDATNAQEAAMQGGRSFVVTAEIIETDVRENGGILYIAKVVTTEDAAVQPDSEIKILSAAPDAEGMISLEESQIYELTLIDNEADSEEELVYTLQAAEKP
ncbi:MAG: hypothetical protein K2L86_01360 [Lachnospiraceae bacterium]|nr:hypothetical protein [Lachnospiraceae bacterium]